MAVKLGGRASRIKVVPYDSQTGHMSYDLVSYLTDTPEHLARFDDMELAEQSAIFLEAFLTSEPSIPSMMTTLEFYAELVKLGIYDDTQNRSTHYSRMRTLGLTPTTHVGRTSYYSKRQLVTVVREHFPDIHVAMMDSIKLFGNSYNLLKRSIT